jgi:hypothetical protein
MNKIELLCAVISYFIMGISVTLLSKTSIAYLDKWMAWIPFANQYIFCKIISDKNNRELERKLLISYGIAFGAFILTILASGSLLASLLLICFFFSTIAISVIVLIADYYLIHNVIPYAKVIIAICLVCNLASYYYTYLGLVQPIIILICSIVVLYKYNTDEKLIAEREINEKKYREDLEKERY